MMSTHLLRKYQVVRKLQEGANGSVFEVRNRGGNERFAMKLTSEESEIKNNLRLRASKIQGLNTCLEYDTLQTHGCAKQCMMVFKLMPTDLFEFVEKVKPDEILCKRIIQRIVKILIDMQDKAKMVQTDLKEENILIDPDTLHIELCDFSDCVNRDELEPKCSFGTPEYMAPETVQRHVFYPTRSIVWNLGVLCYSVLSRKEMPWQGRKYDGTDVNSLDFVNISDEAKRFVLTLLEPDVRVRIDLKHVPHLPWLCC